MTENIGPSSRPLPPHPSMEHLRNQAKARLDGLRRERPDAQLSDAQFALAREHGFPSWRALKEHVDDLARHGMAGPVSSGSPDDPIAAVLNAARSGRVDELATLLDRDPALVNARDAAGNTPLQQAAWRNRPECVRLLLERGADVALRVGEGDLAIHYAAETADLSVVRMLADAGSDVNDEQDHHRLGVLGWATCFGSVRREVADELMSRGARHNVWTAVALDDVEALRRLLDADPSLIAQMRMTDGDRRRTLLHHAVLKNAARAVDVLLARGADVNATDADGRTPLASLGSDPAILDRLIAAGGRVDLIAALSARRYDVAERMLATDPARLAPGGADADALTLAVRQDAYDTVRWLLEHGAAVNAKSNLGEQGATPLHHAALKDTPDMAELLLSYGADPTIEDDHYHGTPLGWANYTNHPAVAQYLRERGIAQ